jgi:hypothetical protein
MMRTAGAWLWIVLTVMTVVPQRTVADDYPSHNVTILVPFAPGGGTDLIARALGAQYLRSGWANHSSLRIVPVLERPSRLASRPRHHLMATR